MSEQAVSDENLSPAERSFRAAWFSNLRRTDAGRPLMTADFVARQGRAVRVVDVRSDGELLGVLGHVPGCDWIPLEEARMALQTVGAYEPLMIVSEDGEKAAQLAAELEQTGHKMIAALLGGMRAWNEAGLSNSRNSDILARRGILSAPMSFNPPVSAGELRATEIQQHLGHPFSVRWIKLAALMTHGRMSCVDGRDHTSVVGTPGGDGGEFLLAIAALEKLLRHPLDTAIASSLFRRRIDVFGRVAIHTDTTAGDRLIAALRADARLKPFIEGMTDPMAWRRFFLTPPPAVRQVLLEHMTKPEHMGCGHLRLMAQHPDWYGVRPGLVFEFQRLFLSERWAGAHGLEVAPLPGGHAEGAVINIHVPGKVEAFSRVPLVAPSVGGRQVFVNHPDVASFIRRQTAIWLSQQDDLFHLPCSDEELFQAIQALHQQQLLATLGQLARGLPIFDVTVLRDGAAEVKLSGHVPA